MVVKVAPRKFRSGDLIKNFEDMEAQRKIVWRALKTWDRSRLRELEGILARERGKLQTIRKAFRELKRTEGWERVEECEKLSDFWKAIRKRGKIISASWGEGTTIADTMRYRNQVQKEK
ncbi:hypothetical protein QAD02_020906 [Eretmocerus hayati]|uniref:Uncharacterized protein n=1 Tax=Eretmocerus hayati TaxID=131215 RepID=A0ACC2PPR1_9HYME|nr:hypothetical protein QAD02_020906 [Eretmocerus hayati]